MWERSLADQVLRALTGACVLGVVTCQDNTCTWDENNRCVCYDETGERFDLTVIEGDANEMPGEGSNLDWGYSFSPCANLDPIPPACPSYAITESRAVRVSATTGLQSCEQLGPGDAVAAGLTVIKLDNGISLQYLWVGRGVTVNMLCDENAPRDSQPERATGQGSFGTADWYTYYVCPGYQASLLGLSVGALMLISGGLATVVYLGGGVAYNRQQGHSGIENVLPNYKWWSQELPDLVRDG